MSKGVGFLRRAQSSDGGWALYGGGTNSQSTAWGIQGLIAAGTAPASVTSGGRSPLSYLAARQVGDGHYRYSASSDQTPIWVTSQALMAIEREPFPIAAVPRSSRPGGLPPASDGPGAAAGPAAKEDPGGGRAHQQKERAAQGRVRRSGQAGRQGTGRERGRRWRRPPVHRRPTSAPRMAASAPATYVGAGLGLLALALAGDFLLYRRQLS